VSRRKKLIIAAVIIAGISIAAFAGFVRSKYMIPIIMYHSVNPVAREDNRLLVVSPETFEKQMRFLKDRRYNVITLEEAAEIISGKKKAPARAIAITFDDGYKDNYTYAFPILKKYNFPATIFIVANEIGVEPDRLTWDLVRAMQQSGLITFGSHSMSHPNLATVVSEEALKNEIVGSKKALEERLGVTVSAFCYPSGRYSAQSRAAVVAAGYKLAVVTNPGKKVPDDDIFLIKRLRISKNCDNLWTFWAETCGYYNLMREFKHK